MNNMYSRHHLVPKSKGGSNHTDNLVRIENRHHVAHHLLFESDTPQEQMQRVFMLNSSALTEEVKSDIIKILSVDDMTYWYRRHIIK